MLSPYLNSPEKDNEILIVVVSTSSLSSREHCLYIRSGLGRNWHLIGIRDTRVSLQVSRRVKTTRVSVGWSLSRNAFSKSLLVFLSSVGHTVS